MNYFGPHEHSVIDFRELEEAPIFLIGGDTGAGKSTIFDAMTFALFGTTTNDGPDGRAAKEMRSQFAPDDKATEVTFYFEQGNQLYRVIRTPEQYLTKTRGNGLIKRPTTAKLSIVDKVGGVETESIAAKPADVGPAIDDILNLSADQFKKIILLPQNDFSEFLKAKTSDKETILKKIFGTQLYSDFTDKLKERYAEASKKGDQFVQELNQQLNAVVWTDDEKEQLSHEADDQKVVLLEDFVGARKTNAKTASAKFSKVNIAVKKAEADYQKARNLQKQFDDLATFKSDYKTNILDKKSELANNRNEVTNLQWANPLKENLHDLDNFKRDLEKNQANEKKFEAQVKQADTSFQAAKAELDKLTSQNSDIEAKTKRVAELTTMIPDVKRIENLQHKLSLLKPQVEKVQQAIDDQTIKIDATAKKITDLNSQLISTDELLHQKDSLNQQRDNLVETLTPIDNDLRHLDKDITHSQATFDDLQKQLADKQAVLVSTQNIATEKLGKRQDLMIAQLQKELVDGEPCVVCGSTDHSHMEKKTDANEEELRNSMDEVDAAQDAAASAKKDVEATQKRFETVTAELDALKKNSEQTQQKLVKTYKELTDSINLTFPADFSMTAAKTVFAEKIKDIDSDLAAANKLVKEIKQLETENQKLTAQLTDSKVELSAKKADVKSNSAELTKLKATIKTDKASSELNDEKTELEQAIKAHQTKLATAQTSVQDNQVTLSKSQTKLDDVKAHSSELQKSYSAQRQNLDTVLNSDNAKTTDEDVLRQWLTEIDKGQLSQLQIKISNYEQESKRLLAEITKLETSLADSEKPDLVKSEQILNDLNNQKDDLLGIKTLADKTLSEAQANLRNVQAIMHKQGDFNKQFDEITGLYNIVTGKDGNDSKLKLETYVVQNYLQRVLNYANDHFINLLSNNRYTFELADESADRRIDHGLDINVFDNETGNARSSSTLSGGETFIAALSIALSLSEVVQSASNGVQIDALFVDEGFGSLDDETLVKAMKALETIGENRMVGVISHIESMKQTIGQQIMITKMGDGKSKVELITK